MPRFAPPALRSLGASLLAVALGCGGGGGGVDPGDLPPPTFTIGGTIAGLTGSGLVLNRNGPVGPNCQSCLDLDVPAGASAFTFPNGVLGGAQYTVSVKTQPVTPSQTCTVANGTGTITNANVTSVAVACTTNSFVVGGTVTGLTGTGLSLQLNGGTPLAVAAGATGFAFPAVPSGTQYTITIATQPAAAPGGPQAAPQTCTLANATGTVGSANVTNVAVSCVTVGFTIGGTVTGLAGTGLVLQNNGGSDLAVPAGATSFTFPGTTAAGSGYQVTVKTQPTAPSQTCTVANAAGTANANVLVAVTCVTNAFTVGGSVAGLAGSGLSLLLNGGAALAVPAGATSFAFPGMVAPGSNYAVTVASHPTGPGQTCTVAGGSGTVGNGNVTSVAVTCTTNPPNSWTVGGTISGLAATGLVLHLNGGSALVVPAGATSFAFPAVPAGTGYAVTVATQPGNQVCQVSNGTGTVGSANVTSVTVACAAATYTVGGTISGYVGSGLSLRFNNQAAVPIAAGATTFSFPNVPSGTAYTITVVPPEWRPFNPPPAWTQICTVTNGSGTVGSGAVTNIAVSCVNGFAVTGTVNNLGSNGGVILLNGGSPIALEVGRPGFTFPPLPVGAPYAVTIQTQPNAPTHLCTITNGNGTMGSAHVTNVQIGCNPTGMIINGTIQGYVGTGLTLRITAMRGGTPQLDGPVLTPQTRTRFIFPDIYNPDDMYSVSIASQPVNPVQTCTIVRGKGRVPTLAQSASGYAIPGGTVQCTTNSTSPLSGVYTLLQGSRRSYLALWPDGTYTFAARSNDPACPLQGNGVEYGVYNWNSSTGAFNLLTAAVDNIGGCGLWTPPGPPPPATLTRSGNTLTITTTGGTFVLTAVASTPGSLVSGWAWGPGNDGGFAVFQADNTYLLAETQQGSYSSGQLPGTERACYTATATTIIANKSGSCQPDGLPVVDTNGSSGFDSSGTPVAYELTGATGLLIELIYRLVRLLPL